MPKDEKTFDQAYAVLKAIKESGLSASGLQKLQEGYLNDLIEAAIRGELPRRNHFRLAVGLQPRDEAVDLGIIDFGKTAAELSGESGYFVGRLGQLDCRPNFKGATPVIGILKFAPGKEIPQYAIDCFVCDHQVWTIAGAHELVTLAKRCRGLLLPNYAVVACSDDKAFVLSGETVEEINDDPRFLLKARERTAYLFVKKAK